MILKTVKLMEKTILSSKSTKDKTIKEKVKIFHLPNFEENNQNDRSINQDQEMEENELDRFKNRIEGFGKGQDFNIFIYS